jgi:hypothetical protein
MQVKLAIGSEESAIIQLQKIQSAYPLKSLAEIVENGIDAKATRIEILRCKRKNSVELIIKDNGKGVAPDVEGNCDVRRIARSICDSIKVKSRKQKNVVGEFGIGLLGFPAIGNNLEMASRCETSKRTAYLRMKAFSIDAETDFSGSKQDVGTTVRVWPVHDNIKQRLTSEKIAKYLGKELSERIRETGVFIRITDKIQGKTMDVKPQDYKGERIPVKDIAIPGKGNLKVRIHIAQQGDPSNKILLFKETKVLDDLTLIDELNHFPWNSPLLEGMIKNRWISISPSRRDIIPDENLTEFIAALKTIEPDIKEKIKEIEEKRGQKLNKEVYTALKSSISETMAALPAIDYVWFNHKGLKCRMPSDMLVHDKDTVTQNTKKKFVKVAEGPLSYIQVNHSFYDAVFNQMVTFKATPWTKQGEKIINKDIKYDWKVSPAFLGTTEVCGDEFNFTAGNELGMAEIRVKATLVYGGKKEVAKKRIMVNILKSSNRKKNIANNAGFLKPISMDKPGEDWRSRLTNSGIEYNTGHRDFKKAEKGKKKVIAERMVEIMTTIENVSNGKQ